MNNRNKVVLIGDGFVGSSYAFALVNSTLASELVIIDIRKDKEVADVNDLLDATVLTSSATIVRSGSYEDCKDADLVVLAYGNSQKNLVNRLDDIKIATEMVLDTVPKVVENGYDGVILLATNPVDVIARVVEEVSGFPFERIVGTGTSLDSARFAQYLALETGFNVADINAYVIGEHGNSSVAVWSNANINGIGIDQFIDNIDDSYKDKVGEMIRDKAFRIIKGKGATHFGIANCLLAFTRAILLDEKRVLMASAKLSGEYKNEGLYTGVPTVIGKNGAEKILEMPIDKREQDMFDKSCRDLKENFLLADLKKNR
ncbi:L-lactate dehydrogenase 2 [Anaerococcus prevotii]|uniref:L-lactate dehydrogenase n=1 Tax=Anaerococcus prevotii (strain ATCC 9321 / DSM 20548 / JCM 6508 / NCTC 11806 / PC1) TaxID=525919 RepID=C7RDJ3_ANAPD|nr:L-lactate dehydrogenase [Anaerococcus prevotii]ACV29256.1 L-lactate dehydrogenase [Anaerococcus prevotii DSM 20548]SUU94931.1 L-lactate dehydrogenase 2 [Anaerococcus prevotii]